MTDSFVLLAWFVILWATGLAGIPIAYRLLHRLPDHGLTLARPLGLLLAGYGFWLLNMLGYLQNGPVSAGLAMGLTLLVGTLWVGRDGWAELTTALRLHWRPIAAGETLFLAVFAAGVWLRAHNPDIVATEKPMELMLINSVLHSPVFPPQDAWLSGYSISYYYFGYVLVALLTHLSGATAAVSFNLSLATWLALSAGGVYGVVLNLVGAVVVADRGPELARARSSHAFWASARLPALLAPVFVILAGNLYGVLRGLYVNGALAETTVIIPYSSAGQTAAVDGSAGAASVGPQFGAVEFWAWLDTQGISGPLAGTVTTRPNLDLGWWWWFQAARITNDRDLTGASVSANVITEFPAFSFILGDLHPHVLALPFDLLALGVSLSWFMVGLEPRARHPGRREVLGSAVVIGALGFLNTWDLPVQLLIVAAAFIVGRAQRDGWPAVRAAWREIALTLGTLTVLCGILYLPFYLAFQSQAGGVLANLVYPTRFQHTVVFFGHILLGVTLVLIVLARREGVRFRWRAAFGWSGALVGLLAGGALALTLFRWFDPVLAATALGPLGDLSMREAAAHIVVRRLLDSWSTLIPAGMTGATAALLGAWTSPRDPVGAGSRTPAPLAFALILIAVGALLVVGPEWLYLRDMFGARMNTVFKLYFQAWVLWGVAGWVGLWWLWRTAGRRVRGVVGATTLAAVGCGLAYTIAGAASVALTEPPTLDGLAYFARTYPDDWAAIQWLESEADPGDVIVEGISGQYWMDGIYSRVSMATGLPTVLGWPGHEGQWRGSALDDVLAEREADVARLYTTRDPAVLSEILARYDVRYVIVGRVEETKYLVGPNAPPLRKFDDALTRVFESGQLIIYERTP